MSYGSLIKEKNLNPATVTAVRYLDQIGLFKLQDWKRQLNRLENNNLASKCIETIDNLIKGKEVSEVDLLSLAWILRFDLYDTITRMEQKEVKKRKEERVKK